MALDTTTTAAGAVAGDVAAGAAVAVSAMA
jgi:hypothetical protein